MLKMKWGKVKWIKKQAFLTLSVRGGFSNFCGLLSDHIFFSAQIWLWVMLVAEWPSDGGDVWHYFVQWENTQPSCECRPSNKLATNWQKLLFSFLSNILFLFCSQGNWNTNKLSNLNKGIELVTGRGRKLGFLVLEHLWITMLGMVFYNIQNFSWNCYEEKMFFFLLNKKFCFYFFCLLKMKKLLVSFI